MLINVREKKKYQWLYLILLPLSYPIIRLQSVAYSRSNFINNNLSFYYADD